MRSKQKKNGSAYERLLGLGRLGPSVVPRTIRL